LAKPYFSKKTISYKGPIQPKNRIQAFKELITRAVKIEEITQRPIFSVKKQGDLA
jgi:hypothetical protein